MNQQQKKKCKELINMGKWNYIFTYGIVRVGMLTALFVILLDKFILDKKIDSFDVTLNIIIFGIGGLILGLWMWGYINKKFKGK